MCHGRYDPIVPLEMARKSFDFLTAQGYSPRWLDYPMQHQVCAEEIVAISHWLVQVLPAIQGTGRPNSRSSSSAKYPAGIVPCFMNSR